MSKLEGYTEVGMDPECIALCDAINNLPGLRTFESCCGHGGMPFRIWFWADSVKALGAIAFNTYRMHVGFDWRVLVQCYEQDGERVRFMLESIATGKDAYEQADIIAAALSGNMKPADKYVKDKVEAAT